MDTSNTSELARYFCIRNSWLGLAVCLTWLPSVTAPDGWSAQPSSPLVEAEVVEPTLNQASNLFDFALTGWASVGQGTTGGAGGIVVTVSTPEGLVSHLGRAEPLIIRVQGIIDLASPFPGFKEDGSYRVSSNKSIIGIGSDAEIRHGEFRLSGVSNVIIRNLTFAGAPDTAIAITNGASRIWIDHNDLTNALDGAVDITRAADFVTISWNRFNSQGKVSLVGAGDTQIDDRGTLRVTYHHNWFVGTSERHPRVRYGRVHVFSNFYQEVTVGIGIGVESQIISENNFFDTSTPYVFRFEPNSPQAGFMRDNGSYFTASNLPPLDDSGISWGPATYYAYDPTHPFDVPFIVSTGAGVGQVGHPPPPAPSPPVGLIAFFPLTEGGGLIARDQSGFDEALDLTLSGDVAWLHGRRGVWLGSGASKMQSSGPAAKLAGRITRTKQFTVEAWAKPATLNQGGPARLISYSINPFNRNFSFAHGSIEEVNRDVVFRLRTTGGTDDNGLPNVVVPSAITEGVSHFVATFDGQALRIYKNGILRVAEPREGGLDYWNWDYPLIVGNEATNNRGWRGELYTVAIFDRALTAVEVLERFESAGSEFEVEEITSFEQWFAQFLPEIDPADPVAGGAGGDAYGLGIPNLLRYALGLPARQPAANNILEATGRLDPDSGDPHLTLVFYRRNPLPDAEVVVEVSSDLLTWQPLESDAILEMEDEGERTKITVRDPVPMNGQGRRFGRIRIQNINGE
jgi:pectate lyase